MYLLTAFLIGMIPFLTIGKKLRRNEKKGQETEKKAPKEKEKTLTCPLNEIMGYEFVTIQKVDNPAEEEMETNTGADDEGYDNPLRAIGGIPDNENDADEENRFRTVASTDMPQTAPEPENTDTETGRLVDESEIVGPVVDMELYNYMDCFESDEYQNVKETEEEIEQWMIEQMKENSSENFEDIPTNDDNPVGETNEDKITTDDLLQEFYDIKTIDDIETISEISSMMGD